MTEYQITFARSARKEIEMLPDSVAEKIFKKIEILAFDPKPVGCKKIQGEHGLWRIRIGDYRVIYRMNVQKKIVDIIRVRHRKEAYR